jgi:hypothetical protein
MGWFSRKIIRTSGTKYDEATLAQFNQMYYYMAL